MEADRRPAAIDCGEMSVSEETTERAIARGLDRWWTSLGREFGPLSRPQRRVLHMIADREATAQPPRVSDVASGLQLTTAGATRMLDTMEALGYATRYRSPGMDQRQVYVTLTAAGRAALQEADDAFNERVAASLEPLATADRQTLAALLRRLTGADTAADGRPTTPHASDGAPADA